MVLKLTFYHYYHPGQLVSIKSQFNNLLCGKTIIYLYWDLLHLNGPGKISQDCDKEKRRKKHIEMYLTAHIIIIHGMFHVVYGKCVAIPPPLI